VGLTAGAVGLILCSVRGFAAPTVITGVVTDEAGRPLADVEVWIPYGDRADGAPVRTGADGAFRLEYESSKYPNWASVLVIATAPGRAFGVAQCPRGREATVKLALGPESQVTGLVLDDQRRPIAGAEVRAEHIESDPAYPRGYVFLGDSSQFSATTDAEGRYTIGHLPKGASPALTAKAEGYAGFATPSGYPVPAEPAAGSGKAYVITLMRAVPLEGAVTHGGQPVAGAAVRAWAEYPFRGDANGRTGRDGHYRLDGLGPGLYTVSVRGDADLVVVAREHVFLPPNGAATGVDFAMTAGGIVEGRVIDADTGQGIATAQVLVQGPAHPASARFPDVGTTDDEGIYRVRVAAGANEVQYTGGAADYAQTHVSLPVTVTDGETARAPDLELKRSPRLTVRVVGPDGRPVPNLPLRLLAGGQLLDEFTDEKREGVVTGVESRFGAAVLARDPESGLVGCGTSQPGQTEPLVVTLEPGATVSLRTVDPDLEPLPGVTVELCARVPGDPQAGGELLSMAFAQVRSGEDGIAQLDGVPPRTGIRIDTEQRTANQPKWPECPPLEPAQTVDLGEVMVDLSLTLIRGTVLNPDQTRAPSVLVQCLAGWDMPQTVCTDTEGRFEFAGLAADQTAALIAYTPDRKLGGFETLKPDWELEPGIQLGPTGTVRGRILKADGTPAAGTQGHVVLRPADLATAVSWGDPVTDEQGRFTASGIIPGADYSLEVFLHQGGGLVKPLLSHAFRPRNTDDLDLGDLTLGPEP
jgi:protocatechuate 3,4-dioxygenase beta subunit